MLTHFLFKVNVIKLNTLQVITYIFIIFFICALLYIQYIFIFKYHYGSVRGMHLADRTVNPRTYALGMQLAQAKYRFIEQRLAQGNTDPMVTLGNLGFRHDRIEFNTPGNYLSEGYIFEKFIDKNSHLAAFNQYYKLEWNWTMTRSIATVRVTSVLIEALITCTDQSI